MSKVEQEAYRLAFNLVLDQLQLAKVDITKVRAWDVEKAAIKLLSEREDELMKAARENLP